MNIYTEINDVLDHMFNACTTSQISEFIPEKRGFRIHGHSTTISLARAFRNVLDPGGARRADAGGVVKVSPRRTAPALCEGVE